jgi:CDP-4-dehydro-6-deoxyglucose reductase, E3
VFWNEEFSEMQKHHPKFRYHLILSRPDESWTGLRGHIQDHVIREVPDVSQRGLYICGNPVMAKEVKEVALKVWGVPKEKMHMEGFV